VHDRVIESLAGCAGRSMLSMDCIIFSIDIVRFVPIDKAATPIPNPIASAVSIGSDI
jgi:hypothetical protein